MKMIMATSKLTDGPMGSTAKLSKDAFSNRVHFVQNHFGPANLSPVMVESAHGNNIHVATAEDAGRAIPDCDGLITTVPNLPLMVTHQDCVPIVISNVEGTFVCVLHAGWRGVIAGILPKAIDLIRRLPRNGGVSNPALSESLGLYFGPGIGPCHFEVKQDVANRFIEITPESVIERDGKLFVDIHAALLAQVTNSGIDGKQVVMSGDCTFHDHSYASWRRDHVIEANMVTVGMLK